MVIVWMFLYFYIYVYLYIFVIGESIVRDVNFDDEREFNLKFDIEFDEEVDNYFEIKLRESCLK